MTTHRSIGTALALLVVASLVVPAAPAHASSTSVAADQEALIYEINRARLDPAGFASRASDIQIPRNLAPAPPLAPNRPLTRSAAFKANEMASHTYFGHKSGVTGTWPNALARGNGYDLPGWWKDDANNIESIHSGSPDPFRVLVSFANSESHRRHIFGEGDFFSQHRQIGVGRSDSANYWAVHTAYQENRSLFVTGAVFADRDGDGFMSRGEGIAGVTVSIGTNTTVTGAGGLYTLRVDRGTHTITTHGAVTDSTTVTVGSANAWVDFVADRGAVIRSSADGTAGGGSSVATAPPAAGTPQGSEATQTASAAPTAGGSTIAATADLLPDARPARAAAEMSRAANPHGAAVVYLVLDEYYPNVLAAGPAAAAQNAPILLVRPDGVPEATKTELRRLRPGSVVVVGSPSEAPKSLLDTVRAVVPGATVARIGTGSRFTTAAELSRAAFSPDVDTVFVTAGRAFPDGLIASQAAVTAGAPLLLIGPRGLAPEVRSELGRLAAKNIVVVGDRVPEAVLTELREYARTVTRVSGDNQYRLSVAVAQSLFSASNETVYVSIGRSYPHALFGSALLRTDPGPVLYVRRNVIPAAVERELRRLSPSRVVFLSAPRLPGAGMLDRFAG
jgi:putative cell wall-binding protein